jgi:hypothetical protein
MVKFLNPDINLFVNQKEVVPSAPLYDLFKFT